MNKNSAREPAIYGLFCEGRLFYIGQTTTNIEERMWQHAYRTRSGHSAPVYEYIRCIGIDNVTIKVIRLLEPFDDAKKIEAQIIADAIQNGNELQNQLSRDGVIDSLSDETKKKIGADRKGKPTWIKGKTGIEAGWTDERKAKQSAMKRASRVQKHGSQLERKKYGCDCSQCVQWETDYYAAMEARKAKNQHGTAASYKHAKCRCDECRTAYRIYQRKFSKSCQ